MAQGKKGFILYADYDVIFQRLTDEEAGKMIKHLFAYVNDRNPEEMDDRMLALLFEPIKMQLKRDLKEWEGKREKRSAAGQKGAEARWAGKQSQEAEEPSIPAPAAATTNPPPPPAKPPTETHLPEETPQQQPTTKRAGEMDIDLIVQKVLLDKSYVMNCQQAGMPPAKLEAWMHAFNRFLRFKGKEYSTEESWRVGFPAWMAYRSYRNGESPDNYNPAQNKQNNKEDGKVISIVSDPGALGKKSGGFGLLSAALKGS